MPTHHCLYCVLRAIDLGTLTLSKENLSHTCSCGGTPHRSQRLIQASTEKKDEIQPTTRPGVPELYEIWYPFPMDITIQCWSQKQVVNETTKCRIVSVANGYYLASM